MCANDWSKKNYPLQVERRRKERVEGSFDDTYLGMVCRVMRKSEPETQEKAA